jgi:hypothetical protein
VFSVGILAETPDILIEVLYGLPQSLEAKDSTSSRIAPRLGDDHSLSDPC